MALADVIVVGAGAAGCVVARRLVEAGQQVVLVEAGPSWPGPPALSSVDTVAALARPERFWSARLARRSSPAAAAGTAAPRYVQGLGVGGGTAVNAMVATCGDRADYDRWARHRDCPGWGSAALEPWLERAVAMVGITVAEPGPLATALGDAAAAAGHSVGGTSLDLDGTGFMAAALTARRGRRSSVADAYGMARPVGGPVAGTVSSAGLEVRVASRVRRLLTRGRRVVGVALDDGTELGASRVVVCAGALATPMLLSASGLAGPARWPVVDHPSFVFTVGLRAGARQGPEEIVPPISALLRWSSERDAPTGSGSGSGCDLMALVMDHVGLGVEGRRYGAVIVTLTDVASTGWVAAEPDGGVRVDPGWLDQADDRRRFRAGVRHVARLLGPGAAEVVAEQVSLDDRGTPLHRLVDLGDDELDRWLADHPGPVRHPAASVPMSGTGRPGTTSGLDGALVGWGGVHLADASVLPHVPNANPMIPVLAVAERLAAGLAGG